MLKALLLATALLAQHDEQVLRVAVVGDVGRGAAAVARGIETLHAQTKLDAIIITGDNFYPCGVTSAADPRWSIVKPLSAIGVPLLPVLGNHDSCGASKPEAQIGAPLPNWQFPSRQYDVHTPLADFLMIDTTPFVIGRGTALVEHVRHGFDSSSARWRIVVGHHVVVSSGWHGRFPAAEHAKMLTLLPALRDAKADLYVCGHDHHLELLDTKPRMLVSGAGSAPIPPVARRPATLWPNEPMRKIGFALLELTRTAMTVRFYDGNGAPLSEPFTFSKE